MLRRSKLPIATAVAAAAFAISAASASAQGQDGLVNVFVGSNQIAVPVAVAANLCDINVRVLARQLTIGETSCTATATSLASHGTGGGGGAR